jgi:ABC-type iron transport system FetAB permease component
MEPWEVALRIVLLGLSAIMLVISLQAWRRNLGRRMMWVMFSFLGFFVLSLLVLLGVIWGDVSWEVPNAIVLLMPLIIGANYLALLKG